MTREGEKNITKSWKEYGLLHLSSSRAAMILSVTCAGVLDQLDHGRFGEMRPTRGRRGALREEQPAPRVRRTVRGDSKHLSVGRFAHLFDATTRAPAAIRT